ncbi:MAG: SdpI family protein [Deltaproteobacteria bacterium]|nr:SdpI family protein [Deltaproteobacteria bacterium]
MSTPMNHSSIPTAPSRGPWIGLAMLAIALAVPAALYGRMPHEVASHWNAYGEIDGTISKPLGPFVSTLACAFVLALYVALPRMSPKGFDLERFRGAYDAIMLTLVATMAVVSVTVSLAAVGFAVPVGAIIGCSVGALFCVIGNYMGKVQRNFFVGVRTPWTLDGFEAELRSRESSGEREGAPSQVGREVWLRTHRVAGKLFLASGVVMAVSSFFGPAIFVGVVAVLVASFVPVVYSYVLHKRLSA